MRIYSHWHQQRKQPTMSPSRALIAEEACHQDKKWKKLLRNNLPFSLFRWMSMFRSFQCCSNNPLSLWYSIASVMLSMKSVMQDKTAPLSPRKDSSSLSLSTRASHVNISNMLDNISARDFTYGKLNIYYLNQTLLLVFMKIKIHTTS